MYRDALVIKLDSNGYLITTCDSCGGIGEKEQDTLKVSGEITGFFTSRVALMEAVSLGGVPINMVLTIANEPIPTAESLIFGAKKALGEMDISVPILMSTEKNMKTSMTALGVVVNSYCKKPLLGSIEKEDKIYVVGKPCQGMAVLQNQNDILNEKNLMALIAQKQVRQVIPGGSGGLAKEALSLGSKMEKKVHLFNGYEDIIKPSCGPATAALVIAPWLETTDISVPVVCVGKIL